MKMKIQKAENDKIKSPAAMDGYIQYQIERDPHHRDNTKLNSTLVEKLNAMCSDLTRLTYIKQARLADKDRSIEIKQQISGHHDRLPPRHLQTNKTTKDTAWYPDHPEEVSVRNSTMFCQNSHQISRVQRKQEHLERVEVYMQ